MSEQERHTTPWRACFGEKMIRTYITNGERTIYTSKDDADFLVAALNTAVRSETAARQDIPEGRGSLPAGALESGSPLDAARGVNPGGAAPGGVGERCDDKPECLSDAACLRIMAASVADVGMPDTADQLRAIAERMERAAPSAVGARYGIGELRTNDYATALLQAAQELLDGSVRMRVFSFDADGLPARLAKRIEKHLSAPRSASGERCPACGMDAKTVREKGCYDDRCRYEMAVTKNATDRTTPEGE